MRTAVGELSSAWRSTLIRALGTDRLDLDRGRVQAKAERAGAVLEGTVQDGVFNLGDPPALAAYEELPGMGIFGSVAAEEGIEGI